jgi:amino acid adenylation domain-containing protein/non-ribosomal peptide synthase protein (TIGR01720 family)
MARIILTEKLKAARDYWLQQVSRELGESTLPLDSPRSAISTGKKDAIHFEIGPDLSTRLERFTGGSAFLVYTASMAALKLCLYQYTGAGAIVVGSPASKDSNNASQSNALAIVTDITGQESFRDLLLSVRQKLTEAYAKQSYPFSALIEDLQPEGNARARSLFNIALSLAEFHTGLPALNNDLTISLSRGRCGLAGIVEFDADLFRRERIELFIGHFERALDEGLKDPTRMIREFDLLTDVERGRLAEWNETGVGNTNGLCIHDFFEAQTERSPDAIALQFEGKQISYREVNRRANQLARHLQSLGVGPEFLVGVGFRRSAELVVAILGILKAGGAYVPLDPNYPQDRLAFTLEDAHVQAIVTEEQVLRLLPPTAAKIVCLDRDAEAIAHYREENPERAATGRNLAYLIYTSGSTGRPKGVAIEHRNAAALLHWAAAVFSVEELAVTLASTSICFDLSVFEMFVPLSCGGKVLIAEDAFQFASLPAASGSTLINTVPSAIRELVNLAAVPRSVSVVNLAGEALKQSLVQDVYRAAAVAKVYNLYGPSEDTTYSTYTLIKREGTGEPSIGRPISNTRVYLLDKHGRRALLGTPGELCLGGEGLARGYFQRPELTAERFIPDSFSGCPGGRLYRTGDLARYTFEGAIDFLGRIDHQVKIHGFRIELGEIESALLQHPQVKESVAVAHESETGRKQLAAYVEAAPTGAPRIADLRRFLAQKLPAYMTPSSFVVLNALPRTPTGKVDRRALPAPELADRDPERGSVGPRTPAEEALVKIWSDVLGVKQVGIYENFFELGGDSILSLQIIARANQVGLHLLPKQLFQSQTIAELATAASVEAPTPIEEGTISGPVPLTPIQHWALEQDLPVEQWSMAVLLELKQIVDPFLLDRVIQHLFERHDALRLRVFHEGAGWRQINAEVEENRRLARIDLSDLSATEQSAAIDRLTEGLRDSLDPANGPLARIALFTLGGEQPDRLFIVVHHFAVDSVSWRTLLEDMQTAYWQLSRGDTIQLLPKTVSYRQWAERLTRQAQQPETRRELSYWLTEERRLVRSLPLDDPNGENSVASTCEAKISLDEHETKALLQEVPRVYGTQINDVLLTALALAVSRWNDDRFLLLDLEGHGRDGIDGVDLSRTVGWFASLFPVLVEVTPFSSLKETLSSIKDQLRRIPGQGVKYGWLRYLCEDGECGQALKSLPQAQIRFNYFGRFDQPSSESQLFRFAPKANRRSGKRRGARRYLFEIDGLIVEKRLHFVWQYSKNLHDRATVEGLAEAFAGALRAIIALAGEADEQVPPPALFPLADLSESELFHAFGQAQFEGA